jgi:hypothetical protein
MNYFYRAAFQSPFALYFVPGTAIHNTSYSQTVFAVLVSLAAVAWLLVMVGLAGGWKRLPLPMLKAITVDSVAMAVVVVTAVLLIALIFRGRLTRQTGREPARSSSASLQAPTARPSVGKIPTRPANRRAQTTQPVGTAHQPSPVRAGEHSKEQIMPLEPKMARVQPKVETKRVHQTHSPLETPAKIVILGPHEGRLLSKPQARVVCGAVSPYAGAQIYIKWSPGANAEQLASQLSQAMDCARVTVTYASETPGLQGHGVHIGTHANEGETTDRIRPFADAITAALRAQGFNVSEVTGASIPANQTAIFIGSD